MSIRKLETCFSPALYKADEYVDSIVVVIDVLRSTSSICTAFANGAAAIIPVAEIEKAKEYKAKGYLVAAERDGFVLDFADFGNSPFNFTREMVEGQTIVYSTTNGTGIIDSAASSYMTVVGSFLNLSALSAWLSRQDRNILLFCAGYKNKFNIEDSLFAGAVAEKLLEINKYSNICDSTLAALDLWSLARNNLRGYIEKTEQRTRLRVKKIDDCIDFCLTPDFTDKIPVMKNGILVDNIL
ncbi:MAG TPA: 2-phosphosulfolactate phosphatase [Bacteroidales bacterium]|nr:2-phosphosulfolactate phosphatase [Bacteroidales bacterium]HPT21494.1 2-phosphosulfolactate phosphatase [Bacteroidales bacterium]